MHLNRSVKNCSELSYKNKDKDSNRFVISIGSLFILFTIYLTLVNIQRKFVNCYFYATNSVINNPLINFPTGKDIDFKGIQHFDKDYNKLPFFDDHNYDICNNFPEFVSKAKTNKISLPSNQLLNDDSNMISTKSKLIRKNQKLMKAIKSTKTIDHKDEQKRKNATAEPIIYLFALTFIYLLLKAVSDIYHHYKAQIRNDANSRRCSLQTYAQYHRTERRVSTKGISLKT